MKERDRFDDPIDRLVGQFLDAEAERVDANALLDGLRRRRARRRIVRLSLWLAPVAAALLIVSGLLIASRQAPAPAPAPPAGFEALALLEWQGPLQAELLSALRQEVEAAWRGARSSGAAAVSAGAAPLMEVAQANRRLPGLIDQAGSALDRFLEAKSPRPESNPKENTKWRL